MPLNSQRLVPYVPRSHRMAQNAFAAFKIEPPRCLPQDGASFVFSWGGESESTNHDFDVRIVQCPPSTRSTRSILMPHGVAGVHSRRLMSVGQQTSTIDRSEEMTNNPTLTSAISLGDIFASSKDAQLCLESQQQIRTGSAGTHIASCDVDRDGSVGTADLLMLLANWG